MMVFFELYRSFFQKSYEEIQQHDILCAARQKWQAQGWDDVSGLDERRLGWALIQAHPEWRQSSASLLEPNKDVLMSVYSNRFGAFSQPMVEFLANTKFSTYVRVCSTQGTSLVSSIRYLPVS